jgi:hypothetical protein
MQLSQFSFLAALGMLVVLAIGITWDKPRLRPAGFLAALLIGGGWWLLRPGANGAASADAVATALSAGQPVVVEVYSDY